MEQIFPKVCVLGLGYIGLPTASLLATKGFRVHGVDIDPRTVSIINDGRIHITEPDLDVLVKSAVQSGRLDASLQPEAADVFIIAVPTPLVDDQQPDLSHVGAAAGAIAPLLKPGDLVILESTSPIGATEWLGEIFAENRPDLTIAGRGKPRQKGAVKGAEAVYLAYCPERVLPGRILRELVDNDRVVGGVDAASAKQAGDFYRRFVSGKVLETKARAAEMCKLTENAFRDVNIAFANELSLICDHCEIDVWHLIELANRHPRVNILQPGPGVGGHCIAVDPWFIVSTAPQQARLIRTAREVNNAKPEFVVARVLQKAARFREPVIACLGLAFKPDVDDLRMSPALQIVARLAEAGAGRLLAVEPFIKALPASLTEAGVVGADLEAAVAQADLVVLLVDHTRFKKMDRDLLLDKVVLDFRGVWRNPQPFSDEGRG